MKRTYIKKVIADLFKAMDQNGYRNSDIMELSLKTCITSKGELFTHVEATISEPGKEGKSFKVTKDFDL